MNNLINQQSMRAIKEIQKENNQSLKQLFRDKINGSFLIKMKEEVVTELGIELFRFFSLKYDNTQMITGNDQTPEYDICRIITGIHRHYSIFLTKEEIRNNQKNPEYQKKLIYEVIEKIRLHRFSNQFFRKQQLLIGDEFIYFPVPYELFALCMRFQYLIQKYKAPILVYYVDIINNALSALTLLENNLLSNAYPLCRSMIEQYIKMLILQKHPECIEHYSKFCEFEVIQSFCGQKYPDEFISSYNTRILPTTNKVEYMHYGWLDSISTYEPNANRYSIYGILEYLQTDANTEKSFALNDLIKLYKVCHGYTHGSSMQVKYPLLQYFEISTMLYYIVKDVFIYLHKKLKLEIHTDDMTLIQNLERDFETLQNQHLNQSTENYELYYSN